MDIPKFNNALLSGKTVLLAPLDWGLGHATRCIPIIKALLKRENKLIIAATGPGKALLQAVFPEIRCVSLPEYRVRLGPSGRRLNPGLLRQLPRLWLVIKKERRWLNAFCRAESIDLIISDNRYGLFHDRIPSVFITHQLCIYSGLGSFIDRRLMRLHFRLIGRFSETWIPDNRELEKSLAGRLSHPPVQPAFPVRYLGLLSRFTTENGAGQTGWPAYDVLVLLSGPEPQRSRFEQLVLKQLRETNHSAVLLRGLPDPPATDSTAGMAPATGERLRIFSHLSTEELRAAMAAAGTIICRSGYSSLMDLIALGKTAVLIPTPGQPEQEYLAGYVSEKGWMTRRDQSCFSIEEIMKAPQGGHRSAAPGSQDLFFNGGFPDAILPQIWENRT